MKAYQRTLKYKWSGLTNWMAKRATGPFRTQRRLLAQTQWYDAKALAEFQWRRFKATLDHAYETVPFYGRLWAEHGLRPDQIQGPADVRRLPVVTKPDVRDGGDDMISRAFDKRHLASARTGGSTGSPLILYRDRRSIGYEHAFVRRQWEWAGLQLTDRSAIFMSKVVADPDQKGGKLYQYVPFMRELIFSTYHLSKETAIDYARTIQRFGVKAVVGYPSALSFLARACLDAGYDLPLRAALTTSELITPKMRETITEAFGCPVFDFYGSAERVCYIHMCDKGSYHIVPDYGYTELIPVDASDPSRCRVVSTGLWNRAMPLIRYDMGDVVVRSDRTCECGRHFPVVEGIDGREGDVIRTPSGRQLGVTLMIQLLYVICGTHNIVESQMIQDALDHLTIEYVPTDGFTDQDRSDFGGLIGQYLPSELKFDLKQVQQCNRTSSGKLRPLVSQLD